MTTEIDNPNTSTIAVVVVVGTLAMLAVSAAVAAYVRFETRELTDERPSTADLRTVRELRTKQRTALEVGPAPGDRTQAPFVMPLGKAQQSLLAEIAKDPSAATPVKPGELPQAPPEPAATESTGPKIIFQAPAATLQPKQPPGQPTLAPIKPVPLKPAPGEVPKGAGAPAAPPAPAPNPSLEQLPAEYGTTPPPDGPRSPARTPAPSPPPQSPSSPVVPGAPATPTAPATPPTPAAPTPAAY